MKSYSICLDFKRLYLGPCIINNCIFCALIKACHSEYLIKYSQLENIAYACHDTWFQGDGVIFVTKKNVAESQSFVM